MSLPFDLMSKEEICKWLKALIKPGEVGTYSDRMSVSAVANYMGTTLPSLYVLIRTGSMSADRQRLLSKIISQVEHGQLVAQYLPKKDKHRGRTKKTLVRVPTEAQKALPPKYRIETHADGTPWVRPVPRVKPIGQMPSFGSLLTKRQ